MNHWLKNLSIAKKLYAIVGMMVLMVAIELVILRYAVNTLSAMRVFAEAAGHWNNAQKNAVLNLYQYAFTKDPTHYLDFNNNLIVPLGYKKARLAIESCDNINDCAAIETAAQGFREGKIPPNDIPNLIRTIRHLRGFPHMNGAASHWRRADRLLDQFVLLGQELHKEISTGQASSRRMDLILGEVELLNKEFSDIQVKLSERTAPGSRFLESALTGILILAMFTVGSIAVYLIYRMVKYFKVSIDEVKEVALQVGKGDFTQRVSVHSTDSLGEMILGLNKMIEDLQTSVGRREQAESASQVKSLFLANMSHEVRTPLGVILGMIEVLKDPSTTSEERQKYLRVIEQTGLNLQQIINDILDISKVEAGHLDIIRSQFGLDDFVEELSLNLQLLAQKGRNLLEFHPEGSLPGQIICDRMRLRQILINLIGNGLKFTHAGKVHVSYGLNGNSLYFRVQDTGIGIPEKEHDRLFKPFSQVDHSSSRKYGGTGLGLLLSKRLAQSLGGDIQLEASAPNEGSVFTLVLPVVVEMTTVESVKVKEDERMEDFEKLKGKRILLVEDSAENQMLIELLLTKKQVVVESANNGQEGMDKALGNPYDVVIMDMQMPLVDGYTATEELRRRGYPVPIIALTAHAMKEDRERCLRVGCNDYMTKPIDSKSFYRTLISHLS